MNKEEITNALNDDTSVLVVIVTYNASPYIERCLDCLGRSTCKHQVLIVDNGSSDNTLEILGKYPDVLVHESGRNLGFGQANNFGLEVFLKSSIPYVFLCNQDIYVEDDTLEKLVDQLETHEQFSVVGPVQLRGDGKQIDGNFVKYLSRNGSDQLLSDVLLRRDECDSTYEIRFINAAAWLMDRNCIETIGGFDPVFFHYGEDDDYAARMIFHGLKMGVCPRLLVIHDRPQPGQNSKPQPTSKVAHRIGVQDRFTIKSSPRPFPLAVFLWMLHSVVKQSKSYLTGDFQKGFARFRSDWKTFFDLPRIGARRRVSRKPGKNYLNSAE